MTAPMPPALDYLLGQLETTAEQCKGGDGSNNALRRNGRGEGLRLAAGLIREAWPAIRAQMELPLAAEAERLRAALDELLADGVVRGMRARIRDHAAEHGVPNPIERAEAALAAPAQPSELWAGLMELLRGLEGSAPQALTSPLAVADRLRELLGLPAKDGRP